MNDIENRPTRGPADPKALAPDVDPRWVDEFVLEQRILGVPGHRIGDELATVQSHVVDSGESAQEGFGDAKTYARAVARPAPVTMGPRVIVSAVLALVGIILVPRGFGSWLQGEPVAFSVGDAVIGVLLLLACAALFRWHTSLFRAVTEHPWRTGLVVPLGIVALFVGILLAGRSVLTEVPVALVVGVGLATLAIGAVLAWGDTEDPVTGPMAQPATYRSGRITAVVGPLFTALNCAMTYLLHLMS